MRFPSGFEFNLLYEKLHNQTLTVSCLLTKSHNRKWFFVTNSGSLKLLIKHYLIVFTYSQSLNFLKTPKASNMMSKSDDERETFGILLFLQSSYDQFSSVTSCVSCCRQMYGDDLLKGSLPQSNDAMDQRCIFLLSHAK